FETGERGPRLKLPLQVIDGVIQELARQSNKLTRAGYPAVVVCSAAARPAVRQLTVSALPKLTIISLNEITRDTKVVPQGQVPLQTIKLPSRRDTDELQRRPKAAALA